jgi:hypothetical protein
MTPTADSLQGFRNRIINGDMRIDQRNAGAAVTVNSVNDTYSVDRFLGAGQSTDGVFTLQRSTTAPTGFTNSLVATVTTADASVGAAQYYLVTQKIEGFNVSDLGFGTANAKTVTLSFWVRSSVTGTFSGALANGAYNRSYPFTYTISSANTFEYKTVTIAGDTTGTWLTDNGIGLRVYWNLGTGVDNTGTAGAWTGAGNVGADSTVALISTLNATWYITGVQLEVGSVATPFERRPYGTELMLCQRYYEQWQGTSTNYSPAGTGLAYANNSVVLPWIYKVTKRIASPSLIVSSAAALAPSNGVGSVTASNSIGLSGVTQVNDQSMMITVSVATTPFTVGQASLVYLTNSSSAYIAVSAEL